MLQYEKIKVKKKKRSFRFVASIAIATWELSQRFIIHFKRGKKHCSGSIVLRFSPRLFSFSKYNSRNLCLAVFMLAPSRLATNWLTEDREHDFSVAIEKLHNAKSLTVGLFI